MARPVAAYAAADRARTSKLRRKFTRLILEGKVGETWTLIGRFDDAGAEYLRSREAAMQSGGWTAFRVTEESGHLEVREYREYDHWHPTRVPAS